MIILNLKTRPGAQDTLNLVRKKNMHIKGK